VQTLVESHLRDKQLRMKEDPFEFLRATYYRWAQVWPEICAECADAPTLLSVDDLHVDSFGTWRTSKADFVGAWMTLTNPIHCLTPRI
jgi:uncharacterized protein (DUF2252 family)